MLCTHISFYSKNYIIYDFYDCHNCTGVSSADNGCDDEVEEENMLHCLY